MTPPPRGEEKQNSLGPLVLMLQWAGVAALFVMVSGVSYMRGRDMMRVEQMELKVHKIESAMPEFASRIDAVKEKLDQLIVQVMNQTEQSIARLVKVESALAVIENTRSEIQRLAILIEGRGRSGDALPK